MRRLALVALALCALVTAGCCGQPVMQLRSPVAFGMEPAQVPGPSQILVPQTYAPTYAPAASSGCFAPGYVLAPPPAPAAAAPCP